MLPTSQLIHYASLSKCYFGIERLRSGIRLKRKFEDDPTDFFNVSSPCLIILVRMLQYLY